MRFDARPDAYEALGYLGYANQPLGEDMAVRLDAAMDACARFAPSGAFRVFAVDRDAGSPEGVRLLQTDFALPGADIARHLEGASAVALLAVTLGYESERVIRRETALSAVDGMLVDAVASSAAESAVESLHAEVSAWASARGLHAGSRFSPGYGDLPLSVQPAFLKAIGADKLLGIGVTDAFLLVPAKSITAVVGLFEDGADEPALKPAPVDGVRPSKCDTCKMAGCCLLRQQGRTCHGG